MHHVYLTVPAFGHITSMHALFRRMLELNSDLHITSVIHTFVKPRVDDMLKDWSADLVKRFDLRAYGTEDMFGSFPQVVEGFFGAVTDVKDKDLRVIGLDQFGTLALVPKARELAPHAKILMTWTGAANCLHSFMAPFAQGGFADYSERAKELARETDKDENEIALALGVHKNAHTEFKGLILKTPEFPNGLYDYERENINTPQMPGVEEGMLRMVDMCKAVDGAICPGSSHFEPNAIMACKKILDVYAVGLQTHNPVWEGRAQLESGALRTFLDRHQKEAVVYISFGSFIGPDTTPRLLAKFVDVLVSLKRPFVLNCQSTRQKSSITSEGLEAAKTWSDAFVIEDWVDQPAILCHPSIGWFVSHCGMNSVTEAIATQTPVVAWPMANDGLTSSAILATRPNPVAFELMQIRQGAARAKPMRGDIHISGTDQDIEKEMRDVLEACYSQKGQELRANMAELRKECFEEREKRVKEEITRLLSI